MLSFMVKFWNFIKEDRPEEKPIDHNHCFICEGTGTDDGICPCVVCEGKGHLSNEEENKARKELNIYV